MDKCQVVLVDGDQDDLLFLSHAFMSTEKVKVLACCCNYEELIAALETGHQPDLIICDFQLPKKTGLDICRELQASNAFRHIPVVILSSSYPSKMAAEEAKSFCVADILLKPDIMQDYERLANRLFEICLEHRRHF